MKHGGTHKDSTALRVYKRPSKVTDLFGGASLHTRTSGERRRLRSNPSCKGTAHLNTVLATTTHHNWTQFRQDSTTSAHGPT